MKRLPRSIERILAGKYRVEWDGVNEEYARFNDDMNYNFIACNENKFDRWVSIYELSGLIQQIGDCYILSTDKECADMDSAVSIIYDEMKRYR